MMLTLVAFIFAIAVLVAVHEWGHFFGSTRLRGQGFAVFSWVWPSAGRLDVDHDRHRIRGGSAAHWRVREDAR